jgi:hypothetical protein
MPSVFHPQLSALHPPQRRLWSELAEVPDSFVLCGGTAVALHLGHRTSIDFDFFGSEEFDPDSLYGAIPFLEHSSVIQKAPRALTCIVEREGPVQVSFFGVPKVKLLKKPVVASDNNLRVAALLDLAGMKAAVVQKRAEAKDYIDIDAIIRLSEIELSTALAAARAIYGTAFNPESTLKSLAYFGDGNLDTLEPEVRGRLVAAVKEVDLDRLPNLDVAEQ